MDNVHKNPRKLSLFTSLASNYYAALPSSRSDRLLKSSSESLFTQEKIEFDNLNAKKSSLAINKFGVLTGPDFKMDCSVSMGLLNKLVDGRLMAIWSEKEKTDNECSSVFLIEDCEVENAKFSECDVNDNGKIEFNGNYKPTKVVSPPKCKSRVDHDSGSSGTLDVENPLLRKRSSNEYDKKGRLDFPNEVGNALLSKRPSQGFSKHDHIAAYLNGVDRMFPKFPPKLWRPSEILEYLGEHEEDSFHAKNDDHEYRTSTSTSDEMIFTFDDL